MARYHILAQLLTVPKPMAIDTAETPADAVRKAREAEQRGSQGVQIGDTEAEQYFPIAQFAAKHGIR
jgi:GTP cyclohydrolase III